MTESPGDTSAIGDTGGLMLLAVTDGGDVGDLYEFKRAVLLGNSLTRRDICLLNGEFCPNVLNLEYGKF